MALNILRLPAVSSRTGLSRSSIYMQASQGSFPASIKIGPRAVGWLESDIQN
ncbi:MAG: AlpA family phage regulatory protein [Gammaproteobacteria bacterium]|jgi:prophage regulatory protein|nr:AlpA family phage regulatory protein [Gammaproteobacteria bacterium]MBT3722744.1 AlpA family phage regulatory protein [Gammaproteobacteria bacterium]MBT4078619.1 AlpA family phage regulatory protein [Gammaproteobacteria bacterium]MBT4193746.1 AlpA family phage regulatory protein [Gammaproteobacteria bacterium]MBT4451889.1 AlpA family phage regulatory protein [Gammaproteobacteria bacterium]